MSLTCHIPLHPYISTYSATTLVIVKIYTTEEILQLYQVSLCLVYIHAIAVSSSACLHYVHALTVTATALLTSVSTPYCICPVGEWMIGLLVECVVDGIIWIKWIMTSVTVMLSVFHIVQHH